MVRWHTVRFQSTVNSSAENPTILPISRFKCRPVENRWRICAQSSKLITLHDGGSPLFNWQSWPYFRLALTTGVSAWLIKRPMGWSLEMRVVAINVSAAFRKALRMWLPRTAISVDYF